MALKRILLSGPAPANRDAAYGGGMGGVARNMSLLLNHYESQRFVLEPCFYSVRKKDARIFSLVSRLVSDVREVLRKSAAANGLHLIAQYRTAIYREFGIAIACQIRRVPFLYHLKAGAFISWIESCNSWERWMARFILKRARVILCEGVEYVEYLSREFGIGSRYFPNYVLDKEVPDSVRMKLGGKTIRVLFVGYCYQGKGVFELLDACYIAAARGLSIELTLIGEEEERFTRYADKRMAEAPQLELRRLGKLAHDEVLAAYESHDVFCMPTRHAGEGHTNTINEAMMMGMVILTTRHGFLEQVLARHTSYFLEELTPTCIARALEEISNNKEEARLMACRARERLRANYTSSITFSQLDGHYDTLTS